MPPTDGVPTQQQQKPGDEQWPTKPKRPSKTFSTTCSRTSTLPSGKILKALPKMAKGAQSPELKAAFEKHRNETEGQVERLQQVFEIFGKRAQGKTCPAIEGILEEGAEILDEFKDSCGARRRPGVGGTGGRALRDRPLRHAEALGRDARHGRMPPSCSARPSTRRSKTDKALTGLANSFANDKAKAA